MNSKLGMDDIDYSDSNFEGDEVDFGEYLEFELDDLESITDKLDTLLDRLRVNNNLQTELLDYAKG